MSGVRSPRRLLAVSFVVAGALLAVASTVSARPGASTGTATRAALGSCGQLPFAPPRNDKKGVLGKQLKRLPAALKGAYNNYQPLLAPSPYVNFRPKKGPPWKIGYANSFSGNAWRASALAALKANFAAAKRQGLVSSLVITDSNGKNDVQIQQMRSLIQQKVDLIISIPGSATALNGVIKQAFAAAIPVLTVASPVETQYAINVDNNQFLYGARQTQGLVYLLGGQGNIMTVQGIKGTPGSQQIEAGSDAVLKTCPNIETVADFGGDWNNATAKTELLKALATHPQKLDGIFQQGSMGKGVIEALKQTGRPIVTVTMGNPDQAELAYWRDAVKDGYRGTGTSQPSGAAFDAAFRIAMRVLEGKGLTVNAIVGNPPMLIDDKNLAAVRSIFKGVSVQTLGQWVKPSWTFDSPGVANPKAGPAGTWLNTATLNYFFKQPGTRYKGISNAIWDK